MIALVMHLVFTPVNAKDLPTICSPGIAAEIMCDLDDATDWGNQGWPA